MKGVHGGFKRKYIGSNAYYPQKVLLCTFITNNIDNFYKYY